MGGEGKKSAVTPDGPKSYHRTTNHVTTLVTGTVMEGKMVYSRLFGLRQGEGVK